MLSACSSASSTDIKTSGLYANISATGQGKGDTSVSTTLTVGALSTTFVEIAGDDALTATSGSDTRKMSKFSLLGLVSYSATLTGDEEGKSVTVALTRASPDVSAPSSVVTLPAKFSLTIPAAGATFKRGTDAIAVGWDNSGKTEPMTVTLNGSCIESIDKSAPSDAGMLTIGSTELKASKDMETKSCDATINVKRTRTGKVGPAYGKGGSATGVQLRSVLVKVTP